MCVRESKRRGVARRKDAIICDEEEKSAQAGFVITLIGIPFWTGCQRYTRSCLASITETLSNKRGNIQQSVEGNGPLLPKLW